MSTIYRASNSRYTNQTTGRTASAKRSSRRKTARRAAAIRKVLFSIVAVFAIGVGIMFATSMNASSVSAYENGLVPSYESIRVEQGDTLWSLAQDLKIGSNMTTKEYVNEVIEMNGLPKSGELHEGQYIMVVRYVAEDAR